MSGWSNDDPLSVCQPTSTASAYPQALCSAWADQVVDCISRSWKATPDSMAYTMEADTMEADTMAEHDEAEVDSMEAYTLPILPVKSEV